MLLTNHLNMIGMNEPIQRKAKFFTNYMRALKGTEDMRATDNTRSSLRPYRPYNDPILPSDLAARLQPDYLRPYTKALYEPPVEPQLRMAAPGYRYIPVSRETYGYSPRTYLSERVPRSGDFAAAKIWDDHLGRLAAIDRYYPSKYPYALRHNPPRLSPITWKTPSSVLKSERRNPVDTVVGYNYAGIPIYSRGGYTRRPLVGLFKPDLTLPRSRITRDPWWWEYPDLKPYDSPSTWYKSPSYLRDSYLSPVKRTYLWTHHPIRPYAHLY